MVTLVVTVVIMLILIGITVNLTIGNNGIVTRTKQAKKDIEQTALNEQYQMNVLYDEMVATSGSSGDDISTEGIPDRIIEYIEAKLEANAKDNMLKMYPVGSIYISTEATDPSELFGGTWESYGQGRTLVGVENGQESEQTGGSKTATLTVENLPSHYHRYTPEGTIASALNNAVAENGGIHGHMIGFDVDFNSNYKWIRKGLTPGSTAGGLGLKFNTEYISGGSAVGSLQAAYAGEHTHTVIGDVSSSFTGITSNTESTGNGASFSIQDPYITTYMWKRTQ